MEQATGTRVRVRWIRGPRMMSEIMRNAGMGIESVGFPEIATMDFEPGRVNNEEQALEAVNKFIRLADDTNHSSIIRCPEILSVEPITKDENE